MIDNRRWERKSLLLKLEASFATFASLTIDDELHSQFAFTLDSFTGLLCFLAEKLDASVMLYKRWLLSVEGT